MGATRAMAQGLCLRSRLSNAHDVILARALGAIVAFFIVSALVAAHCTARNSDGLQLPRRLASSSDLPLRPQDGPQSVCGLLESREKAAVDARRDGQLLESMIHPQAVPDSARSDTGDLLKLLEHR